MSPDVCWAEGRRNTFANRFPVLVIGRVGNQAGKLAMPTRQLS